MLTPIKIYFINVITELVCSLQTKTTLATNQNGRENRHEPGKLEEVLQHLK